MRLLWIRANALDFLRGGGHIRSFHILRRLKLKHEIDFLCFECPAGATPATLQPVEYCSKFYAVPHPRVPPAPNPQGDLPRMVAAYESAQMRSLADVLLRSRKHDLVISDFPFVARNIPEMGRCILFQHNIETVMIERHSAFMPDRGDRALLQAEAAKMRNFEMQACRLAAAVWAVSDVEANLLRSWFGISHVFTIGTGVEVEYFARQGEGARLRTDLVFVGRMDWRPNVDAMIWFVSTTLQLIRKKRPGCSLTVVGREPHPVVRRLALHDRHIFVTGTVPDVRPYLWGATVSIVPLRIGAGTRIKIYEAMAAGTPIVSTHLGAEGLAGEHGRHFFLADDPVEFAEYCLELLCDEERRNKMSQAALELVASRCRWSHVVERCEASFEAVQSHHL